MNKKEQMTLGQAARRIGARLWCIQRLYELGILAEPQRVGILRIVSEKDLPAIRAALIERGYLQAEMPATK